MRQWALLFTATVTSKFECGKQGRVGTVCPEMRAVFVTSDASHALQKVWNKLPHDERDLAQDSCGGYLTDAGEVEKPFIAPSFNFCYGLLALWLFGQCAQFLFVKMPFGNSIIV